MFPVKKVTLPKDIAKAQNGKIATETLVKVDGGLLHRHAAHAWRIMCKAAKKDGVTLGQEGMYRPFDRQLVLFNDRYDIKPTGRVPEVTREYLNKTWYLKKGKSPSATPGTSPHGMAIAVDACVIVKGQKLPISADPDGPGKLKSGTEWLLKNAVEYGFCWQVADPKDPNFEAWHLVYFPGDKIPVKVQVAMAVEYASAVNRVKRAFGAKPR